MPRRNTRRDEIPPLDISPADLPKPSQPKREHRPLHPAHQARLNRENARAALTECAMPLCTKAPIHDDEHGRLGICYACALDVAWHFQKLDEIPALTERGLQRRLKADLDARKQDEEAERRATTPGWIYYIRVDERIKIGYSADVRQRMRAYPPHAELLAVHPGTKTLEADIHGQFKSVLAAGREWFHPTTDLMAHIDDVIRQFGEPDKRHVYRFREGTTEQVRIHKRSRNGANRRR